jgi:ABC-type multidrug transport system fused ATPase/permease subunit
VAQRDPREDRRVRALPIWGSGEIPAERDRSARDDTHSFTSVFKLLLRSWPFIRPQIDGEWIERTFADRSPLQRFALRLSAARVPVGMLWMPVAVTLWWVLGAASGWLTVDEQAARTARAWGGVAGAAPLVLVAAAWLTPFLRRGWPRMLAATAGGLAGALGFVLSWAFIGGAMPKLFGFALLALYTAGWFVRCDVRDAGWHVALRVRSHLVYFYVLGGVARGLTLVTTAYLTGLMIQHILLGQPLPPGRLSSLFGLDALTQGARLTQEQRYELLWLHIGLSLAVVFVTLPVLAALPYYTTFVMQRINQDLRLALVERWQRLSLRYHSDHRVGDSIYRIYQDSAQVTAVIGRLATAFTQLSGLVGAVFLLAFLSPTLAGIALLIGVPVVGWGWWFSPRIRVRSLVARETSSDLTSRVQEIVSGMRVIKAYGAEQLEQERFEQDSAVAFHAAYGARSLAAGVTIVSFTLTALLLIPGEALMAVWAQGAGDVFAAGLLTLFGLAFARWNMTAFDWGKDQLFGSALNVRTLSREWAVAQDMAMGLHRVFDILDIAPDVQDAPDAIRMPRFRDEIVFEKVSFAYDPARPILRDVSFSARAGTITAIVGPTGAGKTTLVTLLLRLFDVERGRIAIDGVDLRKLEVESLREQISIALQENVLFGMSVADNIRYVVPDASDARVCAAARIACAEEFIEELPRGYDTELGDRGGKLSTGQRQRLSIARALLKDAPILVLDEPTAALDAETEHRVMRNLAEWGKDRVIFLITHRLSTIRMADQILYLENGRLLERGTHAELMRSAVGRYRDLLVAEEQLAADAPALASGAR